MCQHWKSLLALATALLIGDLLSAQAEAGLPGITSLSHTTLGKSGRLLLFGSGFGADPDGSALLIDGQTAITTSWSDGEIHGYVPEGSSLGSVLVQVITGTGASNLVPLTVVDRSAQGRKIWSFQMDSSFAGEHVARAADGTVYTSDGQRLYALSPDGALLWVQPAGGGGRVIEIGPDGTIYTSSITAINPDGSVKWQYTPPVYGPALAGPNLGPDGNLYAVQGTLSGGQGVFSLDTDGNFLWSDIPDPGFNEDSSLNNSRIEFSDAATGQLYFYIYHLRSGPYPTLYAYELDGNAAWSRQDGSCQSPFAIDPAGRLVVVGPGLCGVTQVNPSGNDVWNTPPPFGLAWPVQPAVAPDGSIFVADFTTKKLWSLDADGNTRWFDSSDHGQMDHLSVTPDNALLLDGGRQTFGTDGWLRGYAAGDGALLWQIDFPFEGGFTQMTWSRVPAYPQNSAVAYLNTRFLGSGPGYSYLYAIDLDGQNADSWTYGQGWPGSIGIPGILLSGNPLIGSNVSILVDNSTGAATTGFLLFGLSQTSIVTNRGGTLLASQDLLLPVPIPALGLSLPVNIPSNPALSGVSVYFQALQFDPGASHGLSFTPGLGLTFGTQ